MLRKTETLQSAVERYHSDPRRAASDALGNVPVMQSFTRDRAEVRALRGVADKLLAAQMPVLSWWALAAVATRASTTLTVLAIFLLGTWLHLNRAWPRSARSSTFMSLATMLIGRLEQVVGFINAVLHAGAEAAGILRRARHDAGGARPCPDAPDPGRATGLVAFEDVCFSYDGKRPAVADVTFTVTARRDHRAGRRDRLRQIDHARPAAPRVRSAVGPHHGRRHGHPRGDARVAAAQHRRRLPGADAVRPRRSRRICRVGKPDATDEEMRSALERAQAPEFIARHAERASTPSSASAAARCRAASASASRSPARC